MAFAEDEVPLDDVAELQRKAAAMQSVQQLQEKIGEDIGPLSLKLIVGSVIGMYFIYRFLIK